MVSFHSVMCDGTIPVLWWSDNNHDNGLLIQIVGYVNDSLSWKGEPLQNVNVEVCFIMIRHCNRKRVREAVGFNMAKSQ